MNQWTNQSVRETQENSSASGSLLTERERERETEQQINQETLFTSFISRLCISYCVKAEFKTYMLFKKPHKMGQIFKFEINKKNLLLKMHLKENEHECQDLQKL